VENLLRGEPGPRSTIQRERGRKEGIRKELGNTRALLYDFI